MKAKLEQLSKKNHQQSFICYELKRPSFDFLWHYHPEYELTYISRGKGKRLVGDSYENFSDGDLVLLGPLLPHTWVSNKETKQKCSATVIQFTMEFIEPLFQYQEMSAIKKLLAKAGNGLRFEPGKRNSVVELLQQMTQTKGVETFTSLIRVLQMLTTAKATTLTTVQFKPLKGNESQLRINKVFQYVQAGFREKISLQKAASLIHLSVSAFCKFFKRACGKTFSDYVNDIRVGYACQLLIETDKPVTEIAFESGFESLTYFNRVFLRKKLTSPGSFRKNVI